MRTIDADALINRLVFHTNLTIDFKEIVEDVINEMPTIQPEQRWIPCSERLPSKADHTDDMVLVCYRNGSVRFNTYMNGWAQGNPVAWMPLPEPYKEDDK